MNLSVVIPVWNEFETIAVTIDHVRAVLGNVEVIVVDGDPEGSTLKHIRDATGVNTMTAPRGRAHQQNAGARAASGDVVLFLHADTAMPAGAHAAIERVWSEGAVGGAFGVWFDRPGWVYRAGSQYLTLRSRMNRLPYGDQAIFLRRDYFNQVGGFAPVAIMEDVELVRRIRRRGDRLAMLPLRVVTSSRRFVAEGLVRRVLKNIWMTMLYHVGVSPDILIRWYSDSPPSQPGHHPGDVLPPSDHP